MSNKTVQFHNVKRDGNQSNLGGLASAEQTANAEKHASEVGYESIQGWGGALFHTAILNGRDPWEELEVTRKAYPDSKISMLVRGDVLVGYDTNPDDVIYSFISEAAKGGVNVFTIFDGLNDTRNQEVPIRAVQKMKEQGYDVKAQGVICVGDSPAYTMDMYLQSADELYNMGVRDFYIKDPCGVVNPDTMFELVSNLKQKYNDITIGAHVHNTHGLAYASYMAAIEAGIDGIDVAHPEMSENVGHVSSLRMIELIANHPSENVRNRVPLLNIDAIEADSEANATLRLQHQDVEPVYDRDVLKSLHKAKGPGGAASTLKKIMETNMKAVLGLNWRDAQIAIYNNQADMLASLGHPLQVTPHAKNTTEQSAIFLVNRSRKPELKDSLTKPIRKYLTGQFGRVPGKPDPALVAEALRLEGMDKPMEGRPASYLAPRMEKARQMLIDNGVPSASERDVVTVAMWMDEANTGLNHVLKKIRGELKPKEGPKQARFMQDLTDGSGNVYKKNGIPIKSAYDVAMAIGPGTIQKIALDAVEIEKATHGHYKVPKEPEAADTLSLRAAPEYYEEVFEEWENDAKQRIADHTDEISQKLHDAGFVGGQHYAGFEIAKKIIRETCMHLGVSERNIPVLQYKDPVHDKTYKDEPSVTEPNLA